MSYLILLSVIVVRTLTDISFKYAVNNLHFSDAKSILPNLKSIARRPFIWMGLFFALLNVSLWSLCLAHFDLSFAYPFMSISFISVIICGKLLFNEHMDRYKAIGIFFIALGTAFLFLP